MGNSTVTLQALVDSISTIGDLNPVLKNTGGFANEPALTIANDVMSELIAERNPWKWNAMKLWPFPINFSQQDYASVRMKNLGWLTSGYLVDVNSTQVPPPIRQLEIVRDLPVSRAANQYPNQVCWLENDMLEQGKWLPQSLYTDPVGQVSNFPPNGNLNIRDSQMVSILTLTKYGTSGDTWPAAVYPPIDPANPTGPKDYEADITGQVIVDGTCEWTVCDPTAQGIRLSPMPPQSGNVWLVRLFGQRKAPVLTKLGQKLDPIPDDQIKWFRDGFIAYAHRHSSSPAVKARFPMMKADWINSMAAQSAENDREKEAYGEYPTRPLLSPAYYYDPGPGDPYWKQRGYQQ
jgi:hypothetical protein